MSALTVKELTSDKKGESQNGPWERFKVVLVPQDGQGDARTASWFSNKFKAAPSLGQVVPAEWVKQGQYGLEVEQPRSNNGGGGGGRRPSDPKERSSIEMQSSLRSAVDLTVGLARADKLPADFASTEKLTAAIVGIAKAFHAAIQEVSRNA